MLLKELLLCCLLSSCSSLPFKGIGYKYGNIKHIHKPHVTEAHDRSEDQEHATDRSLKKFNPYNYNNLPMKHKLVGENIPIGNTIGRIKPTTPPVDVDDSAKSFDNAALDVLPNRDQWDKSGQNAETSHGMRQGHYDALSYPHPFPNQPDVNVPPHQETPQFHEIEQSSMGDEQESNARPIENNQLNYENQELESNYANSHINKPHPFRQSALKKPTMILNNQIGPPDYNDFQGEVDEPTRENSGAYGLSPYDNEGLDPKIPNVEFQVNAAPIINSSNKHQFHNDGVNKWTKQYNPMINNNRGQLTEDDQQDRIERPGQSYFDMQGSQEKTNNDQKSQFIDEINKSSNLHQHQAPSQANSHHIEKSGPSAQIYSRSNYHDGNKVKYEATDVKDDVDLKQIDEENLLKHKLNQPNMDVKTAADVDNFVNEESFLRSGGKLKKINVAEETKEKLMDEVVGNSRKLAQQKSSHLLSQEAQPVQVPISPISQLSTDFIIAEEPETTTFSLLKDENEVEKEFAFPTEENEQQVSIVSKTEEVSEGPQAQTTEKFDNTSADISSSKKMEEEETASLSIEAQSDNDLAALMKEYFTAISTYNTSSTQYGASVTNNSLLNEDHTEATQGQNEVASETDIAEVISSWPVNPQRENESNSENGSEGETHELVTESSDYNLHAAVHNISDFISSLPVDVQEAIQNSTEDEIDVNTEESFTVPQFINPVPNAKNISDITNDWVIDTQKQHNNVTEISDTDQEIFAVKQNYDESSTEYSFLDSMEGATEKSVGEKLKDLFTVGKNLEQTSTEHAVYDEINVVTSNAQIYDENTTETSIEEEPQEMPSTDQEFFSEILTRIYIGTVPPNKSSEFDSEVEHNHQNSQSIFDKIFSADLKINVSTEPFEDMTELSTNAEIGGETEIIETVSDKISLSNLSQNVLKTTAKKVTTDRSGHFFVETLTESSIDQTNENRGGIIINGEKNDVDEVDAEEIVSKKLSTQIKHNGTTKNKTSTILSDRKTEVWNGTIRESFVNERDEDLIVEKAFIEESVTGSIPFERHINLIKYRPKYSPSYDQRGYSSFHSVEFPKEDNGKLREIQDGNSVKRNLENLKSENEITDHKNMLSMNNVEPAFRKRIFANGDAQKGENPKVKLVLPEIPNLEHHHAEISNLKQPHPEIPSLKHHHVKQKHGKDHGSGKLYRKQPNGKNLHNEHNNFEHGKDQGSGKWHRKQHNGMNLHNEHNKLRTHRPGSPKIFRTYAKPEERFKNKIPWKALENNKKFKKFKKYKNVYPEYIVGNGVKRGVIYAQASGSLDEIDVMGNPLGYDNREKSRGNPADNLNRVLRSDTGNEQDVESLAEDTLDSNKFEPKVKNEDENEKEDDGRGGLSFKKESEQFENHNADSSAKEISKIKNSNELLSPSSKTSVLDENGIDNIEMSENIFPADVKIDEEDGSDSDNNIIANGLADVQDVSFLKNSKEGKYNELPNSIRNIDFRIEKPTPAMHVAKMDTEELQKGPDPVSHHVDDVIAQSLFEADGGGKGNVSINEAGQAIPVEDFTGASTQKDDDGDVDEENEKMTLATQTAKMDTEELQKSPDTVSHHVDDVIAQSVYEAEGGGKGPGQAIPVEDFKGSSSQKYYNFGDVDEENGFRIEKTTLASPAAEMDTEEELQKDPALVSHHVDDVIAHSVYEAEADGERNASRNEAGQAIPAEDFKRASTQEDYNNEDVDEEHAEEAFENSQMNQQNEIKEAMGNQLTQRRTKNGVSQSFQPVGYERQAPNTGADDGEELSADTDGSESSADIDEDESSTEMEGDESSAEQDGNESSAQKAGDYLKTPEEEKSYSKGNARQAEDKMDDSDSENIKNYFL